MPRLPGVVGLVTELVVLSMSAAHQRVALELARGAAQLRTVKLRTALRASARARASSRWKQRASCPPNADGSPDATFRDHWAFDPPRTHEAAAPAPLGNSSCRRRAASRATCPLDSPALGLGHSHRGRSIVDRHRVIGPIGKTARFHRR